MKRLQKFSLWTAMISILFGIGLIGVGFMSGAFQHSLSDWNITIGNYQVSGTKSIMETYQGVEKLDFKLGYCDIVIQPGTEFTISSERVGANFESYVKDGTWHVKTGDTFGSSIRSSLEWIERKSSTVVITIPDIALKEMKLELGAGKLKVDSIKAEKLEFEVGTGNAEFTNSFVEKAKLECGMGELNYQGILGDDSSIECGMGTSKVVLTGNEEDYEYKLKCGMGKIILNGTEHTSVDRKIDSTTKDAPKIKIECGMGRVELLFQQS